MAVLNGAQGGTGAALAVTLHQSLAEDLVVAGILDSSANLGLGGIRADNAVLAGHLVLGTLAELRLNLLVALDGLLETSVNAADLGLVLGRVRLGVGLDGADAVGEGSVKSHGVCGERVELAVGHARGRGIGIIESTLLEHTKLLKVALDLVNASVNVTALIEDGVGVAAAHRAGILC